MAGPRTLAPLRNIGLRFIRHPMATSEQWGEGRPAVTWLSCQIGTATDPEKPTPPVPVDWVQVGSVTFVRNPNYTAFTDPCSKFE